MLRTTREQRIALKQKFDVCPIYPNASSASKIVMKAGWRYGQDEQHGWVWTHPDKKAMFSDAADIVAEYRLAKPIKYREFRKLAQPMFGCGDAIVVPWCDMWLAIEPDGYTHS